MSLKDKSNIVTKYYEVDNFIQLLSQYYFNLEPQLNIITCNLFGVLFRSLWYDCDEIEKIEFIFLSRCYAYHQGWQNAQGRRLKTFFEEQKINFIMRTKHYIEARGKKIIINEDKKNTKQWVVIVDKTDAHVLKEINDPEINEYYYNFTHAKKIEGQKNAIANMWRDHFEVKENTKQYLKKYPNTNLNLNYWVRKMHAFTRHNTFDKKNKYNEKNKDLEEMWNGWDDQRRQQELRELFWLLLIWKILNKNNSRE